MLRDQKLIDQMIRRLENVKDKVPHFTSFGDDNHAVIDAQLDVLRNQLGHNIAEQRYGDEPEMYWTVKSTCNWMWGDDDSTEEVVNAWEELAGIAPDLQGQHAEAEVFPESDKDSDTLVLPAVE